MSVMYSARFNLWYLSICRSSWNPSTGALPFAAVDAAALCIWDPCSFRLALARLLQAYGARVSNFIGLKMTEGEGF